MEKAINFLGTENTTAYAVVGNRLLLIDCGQKVMTQLQEKDILKDISGIDVIITHLHGDILVSLSQLVLFSYFELKKPINIIAECSEIEYLLSGTGVVRYCQIPGFPAERYTRNNDFVTFIPTQHVGEELDCYGFSAEINGNHIVYTGDTTTLKPFIEYLNEGTQLFVNASASGLEDNISFLSELAEKGVDVSLY